MFRGVKFFHSPPIVASTENMPAPAYPIQENDPSPGLAYACVYVITYKYTHYFRHNRVFPALSTVAVCH